jgi:hypothetical protein
MNIWNFPNFYLFPKQKLIFIFFDKDFLINDIFGAIIKEMILMKFFHFFINAILVISKKKIPQKKISKKK